MLLIHQLLNLLQELQCQMEELITLLHKVEESDKLRDINVDVAKAQVEATKASENEVLKRLEETKNEIEDT
ncbi:hypothetical protein ACSQ67_026107 [Phaseolus vulgaris]